MDYTEAGKMWNENAEVWTELSRKGYDVYRDYLNSPAFFEMLPDINNKKGLDIGCGEGYNTRIASKNGGIMTGIDVSEIFIKYAKEHEQQENLDIDYYLSSASDLPFEDASFDFAMATMSFMDIPEQKTSIKEAYRVIKQGGFFQFSISHPCFFTPKWKWITDNNGKRLGVLCGDYFRKLNGEVEEWIFSSAPEHITKNMRKFKIPRFTMTLSEWMNCLIKTGFTIAELCEPYADDELAKKIPEIADTQIVSYFLIIRAVKNDVLS